MIVAAIIGAVGSIAGGLLASSGAKKSAKKAYKSAYRMWLIQTSALRDMWARPEAYGMTRQEADILRQRAEIPIRAGEEEAMREVKASLTRRPILTSGAYLAALAQARAGSAGMRAEVARKTEAERLASIRDIREHAALGIAGVTPPTRAITPSSQEMLGQTLGTIGSNLLASSIASYYANKQQPQQQQPAQTQAYGQQRQFTDPYYQPVQQGWTGQGYSSPYAGYYQQRYNPYSTYGTYSQYR